MNSTSLNLIKIKRLLVCYFRMLDKKSLEQELISIENAEKDIQKAREIIHKIIEPIILNILRIYDDNNFWPGLDKEDITKRIEKSYGINLNNNEIQYVLSNMCKLRKINCGTRLGYKLKIE